MMKGLKIFCILGIAALCMAPVAAMAKGPRFNFSVNFDCLLPPAPPPPPPMMVPCPPPVVYVHPYVEPRIIVREYRYGYPCYKHYYDGYIRAYPPYRPY